MKQLFLTIAGAAGIISVAVGGAWWGMSFVQATWARAWALLATLAIPVTGFLAAWAGWWFGNTEARGKLAGFDKAIDKTFAGLSQASGLQTRHAQGVRQSRKPYAVVLPDVEIVRRRLTEGTVEL